jgi:hypothetical protein
MRLRREARQRRSCSEARALLEHHTLLVAFLIVACGDPSGPEGPGDPSSLVILEGNGQIAVAGTVVPVDPAVRVVDADGRGVPGVAVSFAATGGAGYVDSSIQQTDSTGAASVVWILGVDPASPQRLRASLESLTAEFSAVGVEADPGSTYWGRNRYTEYLAGSLPLVLSAPHGGDWEPEEIPDRTYGTMVHDRNTLDLALRIRDAFLAATGHYPHLIVSLLHRRKLDPNREIIEAAQRNAHAERAWYEFHSFIDAAEAVVARKFGDGFYIDLHGHSHEIQRIEWGYLLSSGDLAVTDEVLGWSDAWARSSVRTLAQASPLGFVELVRGEASMGGIMAARGVPSVPSPNEPDPAGEPYFSGGYDTWRHGSQDGGPVSGVQLEAHYEGIRDTAGNRILFAAALADALIAFFPMHFQRPFDAEPVGTATTAPSAPAL